MGMPQDPARKWPGRVIDREEADGENRVRYIQVFRATAEEYPFWNGSLDIQTGKLICGELQIDYSWLGNDAGKDAKGDPNDPHWEELAKQCVFSLRKDGQNGILQIVNLGESRDNQRCIVSFRFDTNAGAYTVRVMYALDKVIDVIYRDARAQRQFEEQQIKIGITNE